MFLLCGLEDKAFVGHELEREREKKFRERRRASTAGSTHEKICVRGIKLGKGDEEREGEGMCGERIQNVRMLKI